MNSLAYLSRQLDVLASAKKSQPPQSYSGDSRGARDPDRSLHRVNTWTTRSFSVVKQGTLPSTPKPKRSSSSPAISLPSTHRPDSSTSASLVSPNLPSQTHSQLNSFFRRIFFIRVFLLVWDNLRNAWSSVAAVFSRRGPVRAVANVEEKESSEEEEDSSDEAIVTRFKPAAARLQHAPSDLLYIAGPSYLSPPSDVQAPPHQKHTPAGSPPPPPSPASSLDTASRASTPPVHRKSPLHFPKTLVLDLDETLIHSTSRPMHTASRWGLFGLGSWGFGRSNKAAGHTVEVFLGGRSTLYHVYKRPFVDFFLRTVSGWYTLVIFTASMQEYADPVIDWLDAGRGILAHRLFRDSCTQLPNGSYTKDLSLVEADLSRVCLVDNSPISYRVNEANGIPIEGWTHDPHDEALLDLLPVLDSLRFTSDVRRVLGLRSATAAAGASS
ncbi:hypothetical protein AX16_010300 [Volvariella volvacea WC 439]|nr:hypothetical protein AX16_010300 [Volvariella volvacea WC 439]